MKYKSTSVARLLLLVPILYIDLTCLSKVIPKFSKQNEKCKGNFTSISLGKGVTPTELSRLHKITGSSVNPVSISVHRYRVSAVYDQIVSDSGNTPLNEILL